MKGAKFVNNKFSSLAASTLSWMQGAPTRKVVKVVKDHLSLKQGGGEKVSVLVNHDHYLFPDGEQ
ncbi:hypothetical protein FRC11_011477, partial [Ceratobasidium sp. 423]